TYAIGSAADGEACLDMTTPSSTIAYRFRLSTIVMYYIDYRYVNDRADGCHRGGSSSSAIALSGFGEGVFRARDPGEEVDGTGGFREPGTRAPRGSSR